MAAPLLVSCEKDNTEDLPEEEHVHTLEHVEEDNYDWRLFVNDGYKKSECSSKFSNLKFDLYKYMTDGDKLATTEEYRALWEFYGGKKSVCRIFEDAGFTGCSYSILSTHSASDSWPQGFHHLLLSRVAGVVVEAYLCLREYFIFCLSILLWFPCIEVL